MNSEAAFNFREVLSPRFKHPTYLHNQWGFWCRRSCLLLLHTTGCFADRHYESRIVLVKRFYRETSIVMYGWQLSIRKLTSKTDYTRTYNEPTTDGISLTRFGVRSKGGGGHKKHLWVNGIFHQQLPRPQDHPAQTRQIKSLRSQTRDRTRWLRRVADCRKGRRRKIGRGRRSLPSPPPWPI